MGQSTPGPGRRGPGDGRAPELRDRGVALDGLNALPRMPHKSASFTGYAAGFPVICLPFYSTIFRRIAASHATALRVIHSSRTLRLSGVLT
jgi:hypothetical protein